MLSYEMTKGILLLLSGLWLYYIFNIRKTSRAYVDEHKYIALVRYVSPCAVTIIGLMYIFL